MYIREHKIAKKSRNQAQKPVNNHLLPNPLIHQPKAEEAKPQQYSIEEIQAKINDDEWFNSGRIDGAVFSRQVERPKPRGIQMKLAIDKQRDKYEQERNENHSLSNRSIYQPKVKTVEMKCSECESEAKPQSSADPHWIQRDPIYRRIPAKMSALGLNSANQQVVEFGKPSESLTSKTDILYEDAKSQQLHNGSSEQEAVKLSRRLDPKSQECQDLLQKIRNIISDINKRIGELHENINNLPETHPDDNKQPRLSKRGHRRLIDQLKSTLAENKALYVSKCGQLPDDLRESEDPNNNWFQLPNIQWTNPLEWIPPIIFNPSPSRGY